MFFSSKLRIKHLLVTLNKLTNCILVSLLQIYIHVCFFPELTLNPPEGIIAGPANEENFFEWEALIM
jgi:hypothetical protein